MSIWKRSWRRLGNGFQWDGWKGVAAFATTLVAIGTAFIAYRTFDVSQRTLEANTRQQISDRFVKAIEQLANNDKGDVRLGGIYGLEQLAHDSPSDHPAVFDVLTAFVRAQVPAGTGKCTDPTLHLGLPDQSPNASPSVDVQAAINAIATRDRKNDRKGQVLDLSFTCLVAAKWDHLELPGISMTGADLRFTLLDQADLHQANLHDANLTGADLDGANLTGANLHGANLTGAHLLHTSANLAQGADLTGADLGGANLTGATLRFANLTGAHLFDANLTRASVIGADLTGAQLFDANLSDIEWDGGTRWPNGWIRPPGSK